MKKGGRKIKGSEHGLLFLAGSKTKAKAGDVSPLDRYFAEYTKYNPFLAGMMCTITSFWFSRNLLLTVKHGPMCIFKIQW